MNVGWYPFDAFWLNCLFEQKALMTFGVALCLYYRSCHTAMCVHKLALSVKISVTLLCDVIPHFARLWNI